MLKEKEGAVPNESESVDQSTGDLKTEESVLESVIEQDESSSSIPLLQLVQQLLRYLYQNIVFTIQHQIFSILLGFCINDVPFRI